MIKQHAGFFCSTACEAIEYYKYPRKHHGHDERKDCYIDIQIPVKTLKIFNLKRFCRIPRKRSTFMFESNKF
jgi:hypothetical protein